jgi:hypothetical protein
MGANMWDWAVSSCGLGWLGWLWRWAGMGRAAPWGAGEAGRFRLGQLC